MTHEARYQTRQVDGVAHHWVTSNHDKIYDNYFTTLGRENESEDSDS